VKGPKGGLSLPKRAPKAKKTTSSSSGGRHKQLVGLSVGASQLTAAVVVNNGKPKLVKAARHTLPADVVAGGEVRDSEALANEIAAFFAEADLPRKNVRLGIGSSRTGVRVFERPAVDDPRQLANAIRFRAYETLPIPIEEAMLDYHIVEETTTPDRVLLAVAYRDLVDRFAATCAAAKIDLVGIDIEAFALLRAVGGEPLKAGERAEAARVAVSIGHDRTTVAVSDGRLCEFTRVLDWGGARVTAAIERALEVDAGEAEQVKRSLDISGRATEEPGDERTTRAAEAARREVNGLARELASSLHFYQDQPDSLGFAEITITGGGAHLQGLAEQLEELIGIHVRVADPFARVGSGHGISSNGQDGALAVAIGLGIED
jgi:type IV pilus assembly protein PilM